MNDNSIFQNPTGDLASQDESQNLKFQRPDFTLFRTIEGLQQKAGVAKEYLPRLVIKELVDNALDEATDNAQGETVEVHFDQLEIGHYYVVQDNGRGLKGTPQEIAQLFSIGRPLVSTKLLRMPTRGALGNGLRVVAGAVLASKGSLVVTTRNQCITLRPERDGST